MGLSHTVSEIDGNFSRKSQNFPTPLHFVPPIEGRPVHNAVSRLAPRRSAPMHNIGAVMADALLKDTVWWRIFPILTTAHILIMAPPIECDLGYRFRTQTLNPIGAGGQKN